MPSDHAIPNAHAVLLGGGGPVLTVQVPVLVAVLAGGDYVRARVGAAIAPRMDVFSRAPERPHMPLS